MKLIVIDYKIGNLNSIANMLKKIGHKNVGISAKIEDIKTADKLILPGVGSFEYGMTQLRKAPFFEALNQKVLEDKTPIMAICLGAQLLTEGSEEGDPVQGLGWIKGKTIKFRAQEMTNSLKVPHMGWTEVSQAKPSKLFTDMYETPRFYFVHSYHLLCDNQSDVLLQSKYGYSFVAGVEQDNIIGLQFHPEKSHKFGMKIYENFIKYY